MPKTSVRPDNIDKVLKEVAKPTLSREEMKAQRVFLCDGHEVVYEGRIHKATGGFGRAAVLGRGVGWWHQSVLARPDDEHVATKRALFVGPLSGPSAPVSA